jgi:cyclopropane-fatty-acyl-phospholipid synthase
MWEMYLAAAEVGFRYQNLMVFQLQLTKDQKALPLKRDYMHEAERELRLRDSHPAPQRKRRTGS